MNRKDHFRQIPDDELINRIRQGDIDAFEGIVERYESTVANVIYGIQGSTFLRMLRNYFPEIYSASSTRQAARVVLNHERRMAKHLLDKGLIDRGEADRITEGIEERMKILMDAHPSFTMPGSEEMLQDLSWLTGLEQKIMDRVVAGVQTRVFAVRDVLVRENGPDDALFVMVRGKVKIVIGETVVDVVGAGNVIGEMALLTGRPRAASVIAVTPVTVLWMSASKLGPIMKNAPELENRLWEFASMRFARNLLGDSKPFSQWEQKEFSQWLAAGEVVKPGPDTEIDLKNRIGILIAGRARSGTDGSLIEAPATLNPEGYTFEEGARVFLRERKYTS